MIRRFIPLVCLICTLCSSCSSSDEDNASPRPTPRFFAKGADISWVTQMEQEGLEFFNREGQKTECTALMQQIGMNAIRLRVWVNPEEGWNSQEDVLRKARRVRDLGMRLMIDFHYSDRWADPGKQYPPKAWEGLPVGKMQEALAAHTRETLRLLKHNGMEVDWVQVGNETTDGMCWPTGRLSLNPENYARLHDAGYRAVKEVYPRAQVLVHIDNGFDARRFDRVLDVLDKYGARYDMIGMSLYPGVEWERKTRACVENIARLSSERGCPVMVCEVGMPWDKAAEARRMLDYLLGQKTSIRGFAGVFYWEPEAPAGYNGGYSMGAFANGRPTEALDAFKEETKI